MGWDISDYWDDVARSRWITLISEELKRSQPVKLIEKEREVCYAHSESSQSYRAIKLGMGGESDLRHVNTKDKLRICVVITDQINVSTVQPTIWVVSFIRLRT